MAEKKRIAIAGFMHESNTFNPLYTDRAAFLDQSLSFGPAIADEWRAAHHEVGGFLEAVEQHGDEALPIVMAWATPAGPVRADIYEEVTTHLIRELQRLKPDGLLLGLHGAMVAEFHLDADGETVERVRKAMGPDFPLVVTHDFHGNLSQRLIDNCHALVAYRTCPHVDQRDCGHRAANIMHRMLHEGMKPKQALAKPPLIVNIMVHDTSMPPLQPFMAETKRLEQEPGILAVSLLAGFYYADVPQMGPSVVVVTDGDMDLARRKADALGDKLWQARESMAKRLPEAAEAVQQALQTTETPVVLVETGDNVGGGSAADGTIILAELLKQGATDSVVCLFAPDEVQRCIAAGVGQEVDLQVGGKMDRSHGDPLSVHGKIRLIHDGTYMEPEIRHGGKRLNHMGLTALVELAGSNLLVLNTLRHAPFSLGQLTCLGIQPGRMRILVVKAAIAYKAAYRPVVKTTIEVDTPGFTAVNPARFTYKHIRRPLYPLS
jgi:microcystin degradation protein MlrC